MAAWPLLSVGIVKVSTGLAPRRRSSRQAAPEAQARAGEGLLADSPYYLPSLGKLEQKRLRDLIKG